jgi:hypothetical protein
MSGKAHRLACTPPISPGNRLLQPSIGLGLIVVELPPQPGFPVPDAGQKKFNSRLVAPTIFPQKPFDHLAEGLLRLISRLFRISSQVQSAPIWSRVFLRV